MKQKLSFFSPGYSKEKENALKSEKRVEKEQCENKSEFQKANKKFLIFRVAG